MTDKSEKQANAKLSDDHFWIRALVAVCVSVVATIYYEVVGLRNRADESVRINNEDHKEITKSIAGLDKSVAVIGSEIKAMSEDVSEIRKTLKSNAPQNK